MALDGNTQSTKMHAEKRGARYFNMHTLTGAKLTKLMDVKLFGPGKRDSETAGPASNDGAY
jgi:hypothetical protein